MTSNKATRLDPQDTLRKKARKLSAARAAHCATVLLLAAAAMRCDARTGADTMVIDDDADAGDPLAFLEETEDVGAPPPSRLGCSYDDENVGVDVGQRLPLELSWHGYLAGDDGLRVVRAGQFFDCTGELGVHALLVITASFN
jgi:hypothetical protein